MTAPSEATSTAGPRANVLGVGIDPLNLDGAIDRLIYWIENPIARARYACFCPVSTIVACQDDARYRALVNAADLAAPDGMPVVWMARAQGFAGTSRVYGPDFLLRTFERTGDRYRHYFYGGAPGVADLLVGRLRTRFESVNVAGTFSPPFRLLTVEEDAEIVERINASQPDVIWVGLGAPKQDFWAAEHASRLQAKAILAVGAAFDFHSGRVRQAPRWMQRNGLEWLFRLRQEPRRLWRRYFFYNPRFVVGAAAQLAGLRKYDLTSNLGA